MSKIVTCGICGRSFETNKPNKKYCSLSCREAAAKVRRLEWEDRNPGYNMKYQREYRQRNK